ncbi:MAG: hypothetical protein K1X88_21560 [Nannocystaceae bacterium]|nr:hypothetical protein [Nannocystaceae bacterium]
MLACGEPVVPAPAPAQLPDAATPIVEDPPPARVVEDASPPVVRARATSIAAPPGEPESWSFYPEITAPLRGAYARGARADLVLGALAKTLAPYRWASLEDWDNTGFVRIELDGPRGFVRSDAGTIVLQEPDEHQLGCAGGYLEGVRAILAPTLTMSALRHCDADVLAALGEPAPARCAPEDFGLHAIVATARAAEATGATASPPVRLHVVPETIEAIAPLQQPGPVHVCTVSHRSRAKGDVRYYHHMMIVIAPPGDRGLQVFDTTGFGGVQLRVMPRSTFRGYLVSALARNRSHEYDQDSAELDCFAINRRR